MAIARQMAAASKEIAVRTGEEVDQFGIVSPHSNRSTVQAFIQRRIIILDRHSEHALTAAEAKRQRRAARGW